MAQARAIDITSMADGDNRLVFLVDDAENLLDAAHAPKIPQIGMPHKRFLNRLCTQIDVKPQLGKWIVTCLFSEPERG